MKSSWVLNVTMILNLGIVVPSWAQDSNDGLDFLDKVENIKIPVEKESIQKSTTQPTKTNSASEPKKSSKQSTSTKKSSTSSVKKTSTPSSKKNSTITSSLSGTSSNSSTSSSTNKTSQSNPITKSSTQDTNSAVDTNLDEQTTASLESAQWIDESLEMKPDYLPGFVGETPQEQAQSDENKDSDSAKVHPLPQVTGNYSIWNSFTEFLSKYQKAFYIFGILILFGLYRLRSGGSSSSRKSSPTIRRMRR